MQEKLTIAQADFHKLWGGQPEVVLALSTSLARRGHRIIVVCPPGSELEKRSRLAGLAVFTGCGFRKGFKPLALLHDTSELGVFLKRENVQIYHCHGSQDHWTGAVAASRYGVSAKIVRTRHNIYPIHNHMFNRWLFRKRTEQVITIFAEQERYFTETGLLKRENLVTLHSPLPQEFVNPVKVERVLRNEFKIPEQTIVVGFVANSFHPDKAPLDFVAGAAKILTALPERNIRFCMVGHGPLEAQVRAKIKDLVMEERFHLPGFRRDVVNVMASFDILALTSVAREASSTVLKQASALGVPVVATDVGGTREVVEDGKTGLIVRPGDPEEMAQAILALIKDPARALAMGAAGREKVIQEFTAQAIAERTEQVYMRILAAGRN